jgi:hypothetical protein
MEADLPPVFSGNYNYQLRALAAPTARHAAQARKVTSERIVPIMLKTKPAVAMPLDSFLRAIALITIPTIPSNHIGKAFTPGILPPTMLRIPKINPATAITFSFVFHY